METVRRLLGYVDALDTEAMAGMLAPDVEFRHPAATVRGRQETVASLSQMGAPFEDRRHAVARIVGDRDVVAVEGVWTGRHSRTRANP